MWRLGQGHLSRSVIMLYTQPHHKTELQLFWRETAMPGCNLGWWSPWRYFCSDEWLPAWPYKSLSRRPQRPLSAVGLLHFYIKMNKIHISTTCSHSSFPLGLWPGKSGEGCCWLQEGADHIGLGAVFMLLPSRGTGALTASCSHPACLKSAACIDPVSKTEPLSGKAGLAD